MKQFVKYTLYLNKKTKNTAVASKDRHTENQDLCNNLSFSMKLTSPHSKNKVFVGEATMQ
jgi:hypothetical protein